MHYSFDVWPQFFETFLSFDISKCVKFSIKRIKVHWAITSKWLFRKPHGSWKLCTIITWNFLKQVTYLTSIIRRLSLMNLNTDFFCIVFCMGASGCRLQTHSVCLCCVFSIHWRVDTLTREVMRDICSLYRWSAVEHVYLPHDRRGMLCIEHLPIDFVIAQLTEIMRFLNVMCHFLDCLFISLLLLGLNLSPYP